MTKLDTYLKDATFTPSVVGYCVRDNQVLLGLRKKVSTGMGENLIAGIGGKVGDEPGHEDETAEEALVREFGEEILICPQKFEYIGRMRFIFPHKPKWNQDVGVYIVTQWEGEPVETDVIKPMWYEINNVPIQQMWDDNRYFLPQILQRKKLEGIFLYADDSTVSEYRIENI